MTVKPIRNDEEHAEAVRRIEALWDCQPGTPENDELEVLATLVDAYESTRWPEMELDPIEALRVIMEEQDRTQADLARVLGSRSRASEVLNRKRALTVEMIWSISREWKIPADLLVKPYRVNAAA